MASTTKKNEGEVPAGFDLDRDYPVRLGESFKVTSTTNTTGEASAGLAGSEDVAQFHMLRYDFKPKSIDDSEPGEYSWSSEGRVSVSHPQPDKNAMATFQGVAKPVSKECIMWFDPATESFVLERVSSNINLKYVRALDPAKAANAHLQSTATVSDLKARTRSRKAASKRQEKKSGAATAATAEQAVTPTAAAVASATSMADSNTSTTVSTTNADLPDPAPTNNSESAGQDTSQSLDNDAPSSSRPNDETQARSPAKRKHSDDDHGDADTDDTQQRRGVRRTPKRRAKATAASNTR